MSILMMLVQLVVVIVAKMKSEPHICITIDFESLEDQAVTIRDRDSMAPERIAIDQVEAWLAPRLLGC
jgi:hypothetical protein